MDTFRDSASLSNDETQACSRQSRTACEALVDMNIHDKARMLAGATFWTTTAESEHGIESIVLTDGPLGLRLQHGEADHPGLNDSVPATCFPSESTTACSFDRDLLFRMGQAMARECRNHDVAVLLAPGLNMKRSPLCGRNFEYLSEDPLLAGEMGAAEVRGVQSLGVGTSVKHFAANSQEKARLVSDSVVDERALHEIYLRAFETVVRRAQPTTIMGAYNRLNGVYCCENEELLTHTLRDTWGFEGLVVSDWGAMDDPVASVKAGLDLCMPGPRPDMARKLVAAYQAGRLSDGELTRAAERVCALVDRHNATSSIPWLYDVDENLALAREVAERSMVLLENDGILPLRCDERIAVIGAFAKTPRYQGAGSSKINPIALDNAWEALSETCSDLCYAAGYDPATGKATEASLSEAELCARKADACVVFIGLPDSYESEGFDRMTIALPADHDLLVERVCAANPRTVVVLYGGAPMAIPWKDLPAAILLAYLPGCQGGHALARILTGAVNPSGKLAETWPVSLEETALGATFPESDHRVCYRESVYVGYRYYDAVDIEPAYPFGYGRSYTTFVYENMGLACHDGLWFASCDIVNTGARDGEEVVQVYMGFDALRRDSAVFRAPKALAGFEKIAVAAGQRRHVEIPLDVLSFAYWDTDHHEWALEEGVYEVFMAASSRDVRLEGALTLTAGDVVQSDLPNLPAIMVRPRRRVDPAWREKLACYYRPTKGCFARKTAENSDDRPRRSEIAKTYVTIEAYTPEHKDPFRILYGKPFPEKPPRKPYTRNSTIGQISETPIGRIIQGIMRKKMAVMSASADDDMNTMMNAMMNDMPLRMMLLGGVGASVLQGVVDLLNGKVAHGIGSLLKKE